MDIRNVLVPTDFSPPSNLAVNYGVSLARKFRAKLTLLHVLDRPRAEGSHVSETELRRIEDQRREDALQKLGALLAPEDQDDLDLQVVLKTGKVQPEIVAAARERHADVVVLGTHGHGRLGQLILGSATQGLLRKLSVPVLTVCHAISPIAFGRLRFATDLSAFSIEGFPSVLDLVKTLQAELILMHATDRENHSPAVDADARMKLEMLAAQAKAQKVPIQSMLVHGAPAPRILKAAQETGADMILMTIDGKGALERALIGSTSEHVVREAHVPVFTIPVHTAKRLERVGGTC
jgi:nucleotide-binding universal stress UspA family protein